MKTLIFHVVLLWCATLYSAYRLGVNKSDIDFLYDHLIIEKNHRHVMDSMYLETLEIIDERLDKIDSLTNEKIEI